MSALKTLGAVKESTKAISCTNPLLDGVICDEVRNIQFTEFDGATVY